MSEFIQGQSWGDGNGVAILIGVDWEYHAALYPEGGASAYLQALVDAGRFGQALVLEGLSNGLASRMTPAVSETIIKNALGLPEERDPIHFLRLGLEFQR
ncbi:MULTISPECIES: hypothetical protein [Micrococcus]|uniref:Uncharacterized protein n=1 Tax=Micrococcus lylae TaxID=1273 RepID=A0ABY2JWY2_9MICC|nr:MULTISPECIES: hypothetical protein [Micrococcus]TFH97840.1 hypothetical protein E4A49_11640 [Micrococcus lylae]